MASLLGDRVDIIGPQHQSPSHPLVSCKRMEKDNARKNNSNNITEHHDGSKGQSSVVFDNVINNELFCAERCEMRQKERENINKEEQRNGKKSKEKKNQRN